MTDQIKGKDDRFNTESYNVLHEKLLDAQTPGFHVEFDPDEAITVGAFPEDALSESDAIQSSIDLLTTDSLAVSTQGIHHE
ncbi:hypothetical protein [Legionella fairfieldensis]|uniref:hypothetical protein n=1 Tax=Legionella fairfieldensis TaxID=45064 RepID=UPI000686A729|nr:hypothetical protein [Legionella fairfieldensis]